MGKCDLDHSVSSVEKKLKEQETYLPNSIVKGLKEILSKDLPQSSLNEIFHLLKKYDLSSEVERKEREEKLVTYID